MLTCTVVVRLLSSLGGGVCLRGGGSRAIWFAGTAGVGLLGCEVVASGRGMGLLGGAMLSTRDLILFLRATILLLRAGVCVVRDVILFVGTAN